MSESKRAAAILALEKIHGHDFDQCEHAKIGECIAWAREKAGAALRSERAHVYDDWDGQTYHGVGGADPTVLAKIRRCSVCRTYAVVTVTKALEDRTSEDYNRKGEQSFCLRCIDTDKETALSMWRDSANIARHTLKGLKARVQHAQQSLDEAEPRCLEAIERHKALTGKG